MATRVAAATNCQPGDVHAVGNDFQVLYQLSRLAYSDRVNEPDQLALWRRGRE